ncbi:hypothetical protein [Stratiformator vulcanicus]|uniref:Uncharacterized protein n=1 Tax=Stratiformator vulcanicus TaxID=2527980 RepID=A0A517R714_9PLAN|nr:hypothetical protein [Stratiformator vulcanicus]QDT39678.1 hypothetical protein Pan189_40870 [Stratiformator vulcanicus]
MEVIGNRLAWVVAMIVIALPVLYQFDRLDPWLAWRVYAVTKIRPRIQFLHAGKVEAEPAAAFLQRPWVSSSVGYDYSGPSGFEPPANLTNYTIRAHRWSLAEIDVPLYQADRIYVGIALGTSRIGPPLNWISKSVRTNQADFEVWRTNIKRRLKHSPDFRLRIVFRNFEPQQESVLNYYPRGMKIEPE